MNTLDENEEGCTIISPDKTIKWERAIIGFVDDKREYANNCKTQLITHRLQQPSISNTKLGISTLYFWW